MAGRGREPKKVIAHTDARARDAVRARRGLAPLAANMTAAQDRAASGPQYGQGDGIHGGLLCIMYYTVFYCIDCIIHNTHITPEQLLYLS